jgi:malate dehydrogenase
MNRKIAIIGASGTVGSCAAYAIAMQGLTTELVLIDQNRNLALSHQMDLQSAISCLNETKVRVAKQIEELENADVVIVAASAPWKRVSSRIELLKANLPVIESIAEIVRQRCSNAVVITVTNPVDPLNWVLWRRAELDRDQCLGYSLNDSIRFRFLVGEMLEVPSAAVDGLVIGEHGENCVLLFSAVRVYGEAVEICEEDREKIRMKLARVIHDFEDLKTGRTSGWTCAVGISSMVRAILEGTEQLFPCSVVLDGEFGRREISATVPVYLGHRGRIGLNMEQLSCDETQQLEACFDSLQGTVQSIKEIGYY